MFPVSQLRRNLQRTQSFGRRRRSPNRKPPEGNPHLEGCPARGRHRNPKSSELKTCFHGGCHLYWICYLLIWPYLRTPSLRNSEETIFQTDENDERKSIFTNLVILNPFDWVQGKLREESIQLAINLIRWDSSLRSEWQTGYLSFWTKWRMTDTRFVIARPRRKNAFFKHAEIDEFTKLVIGRKNDEAIYHTMDNLDCFVPLLKCDNLNPAGIISR